MSRSCALPCLLLLVAACSAEDPPLQVRIGNLTAPFAAHPEIGIELRNGGDAAMSAEVVVLWPEGWAGEPASRHVELPARTTVTPRFTVTAGTATESNDYSLSVAVKADGSDLVISQRIPCAITPRLTPAIDGRLDDWAAALPIVVHDGGKKATVMTAWNETAFFVGAVVEDPDLSGFDAIAEGKSCDGIQIAVAPQPAGTEGAREVVAHWEFLVTPADGKGLGPARAFLLRKPGDAAADAREQRSLDPLACPQMQVAAIREGRETRYEVAIPLSLMPGFVPAAGKTFRFSLIAHDGDDLTYCDLGSVMNLGEERRDPLAWCRWKGDSLESRIPLDHRIEFGFCTAVR